MDLALTFKMGIKSTANGTGPATGIKVIIVGAGFGGLTAAIECHRQGHSVTIFESFPELKVLGDIISFGPNAGRIFHRWGTKDGGTVADRMRPLSIDLREYGFRIHKYDTGEVVAHQKTPPGDPEAPVFNGHRGELHKVVFEYAKDEIGIDIRLGSRVVRYFEDTNEAGIELEGGERACNFPNLENIYTDKLQIVADVVIGADGVRSKARALVLGYEDNPKSSGYAIWRAWYGFLSR